MGVRTTADLDLYWHWLNCKAGSLFSIDLRDRFGLQHLSYPGHSLGLWVVQMADPLIAYVCDRSTMANSMAEHRFIRVMPSYSSQETSKSYSIQINDWS